MRWSHWVNFKDRNIWSQGLWQPQTIHTQQSKINKVLRFYSEVGLPRKYSRLQMISQIASKRCTSSTNKIKLRDQLKVWSSTFINSIAICGLHQHNNRPSDLCKIFKRFNLSAWTDTTATPPKCPAGFCISIFQLELTQQQRYYNVLQVFIFQSFSLNWHNSDATITSCRIFQQLSQKNQT